MGASGRQIAIWSSTAKQFARLSARERFLMLIMIIAAAIATYVLAVATPSEDSRVTLRQETEQANALNRRVEALGAIDADTTRPADPRPLPVLLAETAEDFDVTLSRLSERDAGVELEVASLPFDALVVWLHALMNTYGVIVESIEINRTLEPASVSARISFSTSLAGQ